MELNEAITHAREKAEEQKKKAERNIIETTKEGWIRVYDGKEYNDCLKCAKEHEQLAEWLTELQSDRKLISVIRSIVWDNSLYDGIKIDKLRRLLSAYKESEAENE